MSISIKKNDEVARRINGVMFSTSNDPKTTNDPHCEPQVIPVKMVDWRKVLMSGR